MIISVSVKTAGMKNSMRPYLLMEEVSIFMVEKQDMSRRLELFNE